MKNESLRLSFAINEALQLSLVRAVVCSAIPYPSSDLGEREGVSGTWVQLEDGSQNVVYRTDLLAPMTAGSRKSGGAGDREYDVLVPNYPDARFVAVYSLPAADGAAREPFGDESVLLLRTSVTAPVSADIRTVPDLPYDICGKGYGRVLRKYTVVCNRENQMVYNLVLLADGFGGAEQDKFVECARKCVNFLLSRPPFSTSYGMCSMNVHFVEVETFDNNRPYFSTKVGEATHVDWDKADVKKVCDSLFSENGQPYWHWAGIIKNYEERRIGTAEYKGGQFVVGICTDYYNDDYIKGLQHEFGHAAFTLTDEYELAGSGTYSGAEPNFPNVTKACTLDALKWKELVTSGVSIPTSENEKDKVGCFEGAYYYKRGVFRPQYVCVMRKHADADGYYCRVCAHHAAKLITKSIGMYVPAPGSLCYSGAGRYWSAAVMAVRVTDKEVGKGNYKEYDGIVEELNAQKKVGSCVKKLFREACISLPEDAEVFEIQYLRHELGYRGLWYLVSKDRSVMNYVNTSKIDHENEIYIGRLLIPAYPVLTIFDGARVGMGTHIFCSDNGRLSYGIQDQSGNLIKDFSVQQVGGFNEKAGITSISVEYVNSRFMVAAVDAGKIKMAVYKLLSETWEETGAVPMPSEGTDEYITVKTAYTKNNIHVASVLGREIRYGLFNAVSMRWENTDKLLLDAPLAYFDICAGNNNVYVLTYDGTASKLYEYSTIARTWAGPADISNQLGFSAADIITSWNTAMLGNCIHLTVIVNRGGEKKMMHAAYNTVSRAREIALAEIKPLYPIRSDIGGMALHSTGSQLHLILSGMTKAFPLTK